jgi:hypothetical protein
MSSRNGHATLYDFRDLDLLLKIEAEGDQEGWVDSEHMARSLGFGDDRMPISRRLAWMRHYGMLDFDQQQRIWRVSPGGRRVIEAKLRAAQARTIEALPDESMIEVMANIGSRYHLADPMTAAMLRREFLFGTKKR